MQCVKSAWAKNKKKQDRNTLTKTEIPKHSVVGSYIGLEFGNTDFYRSLFGLHC